MKFVFDALVAIHIVGALAIAWGFFSQLRGSSRGINAAMLHGASTQLATGVIMVGLADTGGVDESFAMGTITVKLLVALLMLAACVKGRRATGETSRWWMAVGVLWVVNVALGATLAS